MISSGEPCSSERQTPKRFSTTAFAAVEIALAVSVTLNVLLAHRLEGLNNARSARIADHLLLPGSTVPTITANRLGGHEERISFQDSNQPTVLYVFTPPCSWCARNLDNLETLVAKERSQYRFIGLSLGKEGLSEYVAAHGLTIPIYTDLSAETQKAYKLGGTPQTIVISSEGRVLQDWAGAYVAAQKSQVEAFFHVSLPGITPIRKPTVTGGG
jgi:peroxiredoxin